MPSLRDYFNLKACPSISQSSIWSKLFQGVLLISNTNHWSLQGRQEASGQCCSPSAQGSRPPRHKSLLCIQVWKLQSTETAENTVPHFHHSPWEAPHVHFQEERYSSQCLTSPYSPVQGVKHTKSQQKSVQILGGSLSFQLWLHLQAVSTAPKQCFKRFHPGVEIELLWETYQISSWNINCQLNSLNI